VDDGVTSASRACWPAAAAARQPALWLIPGRGARWQAGAESGGRQYLGTMAVMASGRGTLRKAGDAP
jgi:hypothetical protein